MKAVRSIFGGGRNKRRSKNGNDSWDDGHPDPYAAPPRNKGESSSSHGDDGLVIDKYSHQHPPGTPKQRRARSSSPAFRIFDSNDPNARNAQYPQYSPQEEEKRTLSSPPTPTGNNTGPSKDGGSKVYKKGPPKAKRHVSHGSAPPSPARPLLGDRGPPTGNSMLTQSPITPNTKTPQSSNKKKKKSIIVASKKEGVPKRRPTQPPGPSSASSGQSPQRRPKAYKSTNVAGTAGPSSLLAEEEELFNSSNNDSIATPTESEEERKKLELQEKQLLKRKRSWKAAMKRMNAKANANNKSSDSGETSDTRVGGASGHSGDADDSFIASSATSSISSPSKGPRKKKSGKANKSTSSSPLHDSFQSTGSATERSTGSSKTPTSTKKKKGKLAKPIKKKSSASPTSSRKRPNDGNVVGADLNSNNYTEIELSGHDYDDDKYDDLFTSPPPPPTSSSALDGATYEAMSSSFPNLHQNDDDKQKSPEEGKQHHSSPSDKNQSSMNSISEVAIDALLSLPGSPVTTATNTNTNNTQRNSTANSSLTSLGSPTPSIGKSLGSPNTSISRGLSLASTAENSKSTLDYSIDSNLLRSFSSSAGGDFNDASEGGASDELQYSSFTLRGGIDDEGIVDVPEDSGRPYVAQQYPSIAAPNVPNSNMSEWSDEDDETIGRDDDDDDDDEVLSLHAIPEATEEEEDAATTDEDDAALFNELSHRHSSSWEHDTNNTSSTNNDVLEMDSSDDEDMVQGTTGDETDDDGPISKSVPIGSGKEKRTGNGATDGTPIGVDIDVSATTSASDNADMDETNNENNESSQILNYHASSWDDDELSDDDKGDKNHVSTKIKDFDNGNNTDDHDTFASQSIDEDDLDKDAEVDGTVEGTSDDRHGLSRRSLDTSLDSLDPPPPPQVEFMSSSSGRVGSEQGKVETADGTGANEDGVEEKELEILEEAIGSERYEHVNEEKVANNAYVHKSLGVATGERDRGEQDSGRPPPRIMDFYPPPILTSKLEATHSNFEADDGDESSTDSGLSNGRLHSSMDESFDSELKSDIDEPHRIATDDEHDDIADELMAEVLDKSVQSSDKKFRQSDDVYDPTEAITDSSRDTDADRAGPDVGQQDMANMKDERSENRFEDQSNGMDIDSSEAEFGITAQATQSRSGKRNNSESAKVNHGGGAIAAPPPSRDDAEVKLAQSHASSVSFDSASTATSSDYDASHEGQVDAYDETVEKTVIGLPASMSPSKSADYSSDSVSTFNKSPGVNSDDGVIILSEQDMSELSGQLDTKDGFQPQNPEFNSNQERGDRKESNGLDPTIEISTPVIASNSVIGRGDLTAPLDTTEASQAMEKSLSDAPVSADNDKLNASNSDKDDVSSQSQRGEESQSSAGVHYENEQNAQPMSPLMDKPETGLLAAPKSPSAFPGYPLVAPREMLEDESELNNPNRRVPAASEFRSPAIEKLQAAKKAATMKLRSGLDELREHSKVDLTSAALEQSRLESELASSLQVMSSQSKVIDLLRDQNLNSQEQLSSALSNVKVLMEEKLELKRKLTQAEEALEISKKENELAKENKQSTQSADGKDAKIASLEKAVGDLTLQNGTLEEKLIQGDLELDKMGIEMEHLYEEIENLKDTCAEYQSSKDQLDEAIVQLEDRERAIEELTRLLGEKDLKILELGQKSGESTTEISENDDDSGLPKDVELRLNDMRHRLTASQEEIETLKEELRQAKNRLDISNLALERQTEVRQDSSSSGGPSNVKKEISVLKEENATLNARLNEKLVLTNEQTQRILALEKELEEKLAEKGELEAKFSTLSSTLDEAMRNSTAEEASLVAVKAEAALLRDKLESLQLASAAALTQKDGSIAVLQRSLTAFKDDSDYDELAQQLELVAKELSETKAALENAKRVDASKIDSLEVENATFRERIKSMQSETTAMLKTKDESIAGLQKRINGYKNEPEFVSMSQQLKKFQSELDVAKQRAGRVDKLEAANDKLRRDLDALKLETTTKLSGKDLTITGLRKTVREQSRKLGEQDSELARTRLELQDAGTTKKQQQQDRETAAQTQSIEKENAKLRQQIQQLQQRTQQQLSMKDETLQNTTAELVEAKSALRDASQRIAVLWEENARLQRMNGNK